MALARAQAHELAGGCPFTSWTLHEGFAKNKVIAFDYIVPYLTQTTNDITVIGHSTTKQHEINRISCATRDETRRASVLRTHLALSAKNHTRHF